MGPPQVGQRPGEDKRLEKGDRGKNETGPGKNTQGSVNWGPKVGGERTLQNFACAGQSSKFWGVSLEGRTVLLIEKGGGDIFTRQLDTLQL